MTPTPNFATSSQTAKDLVDVSVFGPDALAPGDEGLIQVLLHQFDDEEVAAAMAAEADPSSRRRGVQTLAAQIAHGQGVQISLEANGAGD
jgi:hypothetical protein